MGSDDAGVGEVFEFLAVPLDIMHSFGNKRGSCGHTALMVRMERFTIAVCISSIGAMLVRFAVSDYGSNRKGVYISTKVSE